MTPSTTKSPRSETKTKVGHVTNAVSAFLERLPVEERMARLLPPTEADIASIGADFLTKPPTRLAIA